MKSLMSEQTQESFFQLADVAPKSHANLLDDLVPELIMQSHYWTKPDNNHTPAVMAQRIFDKKFKMLSEIDNVMLKIALISKLALKTPRLVESENFPDSILVCYPAAFDRLSLVLQKRAEQPLDMTGNLLHRIGFVLAINIPCGAQLLDLNSSIPLSSAILSVHRERSIKSLIRYCYCKGTGLWFRGHTDTGYLEEFNEVGWDNFYLRIAELLLRRKHMRGLVGTSWFYDPQLINISPRLAYLQQRQLERGAFLMRHRGTESDIKFATSTSDTRRRLCQEGKYTPISYSLIWGRSELLSWAKTV